MYFVVDIETTGLDRESANIVQVAAVALPEDDLFSAKKRDSFTVDIQPIEGRTIDPKSMEVNKLSIDHLLKNGIDPTIAFLDFFTWVREHTPKKEKPIFVAQNSSFDYEFIKEYAKVLGLENPFDKSRGHIDLRSMIFASGELPWNKTSTYYMRELDGGHNALQDAIAEAKVFKKIMGRRRAW
jgi:DNA polymerase III epsilon subunit-like protein